MNHTKLVDYEKVFKALPDLHVVLSPDFRILAATNTYIATSQKAFKEIAGMNILEAFPDSPYNDKAKGNLNLRHSLEEVVRTRQPHRMGVVRYDIETADRPEGTFVERWWRPLNTPILNAAGKVQYIIHTVEDINHAIDVLEDAEQVVQKRTGARAI